MSVKNKLLIRAAEILDGPLTLDKAILLAVISHAGQEDKGQNSYIRHPLRVMEEMDTEDEMVVAVCHDIVEDCSITLSDLESLGFTKGQTKAIDALTKRDNEDYTIALDRVMNSIVARKVKEKDIRDNMQLWRLKSRQIGPKDFERYEKYVKGLIQLGVLDKRD